MKRLLAWPGVAVLAALFASSLPAQPLPLVKVTDSGDPNLVLPSGSGTYVVAEYYCTNDNHTGAYTVNGLTFTNNIGRVPGTRGTGNPGTPMFTGADATALWTISQGEQWATNITFTLPTVAGHSYLLELLFHDNYYSVTGKRVFTVLAGPAGYPTNVLAANLDLNAQGAGANTAADILVRYVLNDSDGSGIEVKLSASSDNALLCATALLDATGVAPNILLGPAPQTSYPGLHATFPCVALGSSIDYQWQSDTGGTMANLSDGPKVSGATTRTLTLSQLAPADQGNYQLVASNPSGSTTSVPGYLALAQASGLSLITSPTDLNLILTNTLLFAEYYGADFGPLTIGGATFRNNNARIGGNTATQNLPYFGSSQDATNLALIAYTDQWAPNGGTFDFVLPTTPGRSYVLQLLFHDNAYAAAGRRIFNVYAGPQGNLTNWVQDLDLAYTGAYTTNPVILALTLPAANSDGTPLEVQLVAGAKDNPLIDAMTWQDVSGQPVPPMIVGQPASTNVFAGRTFSLNVQAVGAPLNYQWQSSPANAGTFSPLSEGGHYSGSATATLTFDNSITAQTADYQVTVSNGAGAINSTVANVTVLSPPPFTPGQNYGSAVLYSNNAVHYWRLNEPANTPMVYDSGPGAKDGVVGSSLLYGLGAAGPASPDYPGFGAGNTGLQTYGGAPNDHITVPPLNLNTNAVTLLAWLNPTSPQQAGAGLLLSRQGTSGTFNSGLTYGLTLQSNLDYSLRYFWNGASVDSGLLVPQNLWSLVGLVVTSNSAAIYIVNTNGMTTWSQSGTFATCPFSNPFLIGNDTADSGSGLRTFSGYIDEVAVFKHALTASQILGLFTNATGVAAVPPTVTTATPALSTVNPGVTVTLNATSGGVPTPSVQWRKRALGSRGAFVDVPNATNNTLTLSNVTAAGSSGDYVLFVSNKVGTVTSAPARVLVAQASPPALVGQWLNGNPTLAEVSGYHAPGLHDGVLVGNGGTWSLGDVPPGFDLGLSSLALAGGAVAITNTATSDSDYRLDFDNHITNRFTIAFWAKGFPTASWACFLSKSGENPGGWQFRHYNNHAGVPTFTVRGLSDNNPDGIGSGASVRYTDSSPTWHHWVGTYDSITGVRHLYMDGVDAMNLIGEYNGVTPANTFHLVLGGKDTGSFGTYFTGSLFDVRLYNYAVTPAEVQAMRNPASAGAVGMYFGATTALPLGRPEAFTVLIPVGANASGPVTVWVTNNAPSVAVIRGAGGNVFAVSFATGAPNSQSFLLDSVGTGTTSFALGNSAGLGSAPVPSLSVIQPQLIGHWLTGPQSLADTAHFAGEGVHDAAASVNTSIGGGSVQWSNDVPAGFSGSSVFFDGTYALTVNNSSTLAGSGYQPTFDADIAQGFSVSFWAKGIPTNSAGGGPWLSKRGQTANQTGWQVSLLTTLNVPTFIVRETGANAYPNPFNSSVLLNGFKTTWHHFTATWDSLSGLRKLYVDGKLAFWLGQDYGPLPLPSYAYLTFGGQDKCDGYSTTVPTLDTANYFVGQMFDVRMYNYALSASEVQTAMNPNAATALRAGADNAVIDVGRTGSVSLALPPGANAGAAVTVYVTNLTPAVVSIAGHAEDVFPLTFPAGAYSAAQLSLTGLSQGQAVIAVGGAGFSPASATVQVNAPALVGRWLVGATNLTEYSGFMPPGTHDGLAVGAATNLGFSTDVPAGFPGRSLNLNNSYAVLVTNSAATDTQYATTFDDALAHNFTLTFWTKAGSQGAWKAWLSKHGDSGIGFQIRQYNNTGKEDFCLRQTALHASSQSGSIEDLLPTTGRLYDNQWHHVAAVWDGYNGTRQFFVDGQLNPGMSLSGDYGPFALASNHHLVLGTEESNAVGSFNPQNGYLNGLMYDVRVYNYPLAPGQIADLLVPPAPPVLTVEPQPDGTLKLSWSAAGYVLQTSPNLVPGAWTPASLPVSNQAGQFSTTDTLGAGAKYYRLVLY